MGRIEELIKRIKDLMPPDCDDAFRSLFEEHRRLVYWVVSPYAQGDPQQIEDLVQETFIRLWCAIRKGQVEVTNERELRNLIWTIARSAALDDARRRGASKRPRIEYVESPPDIFTLPTQEGHITLMERLFDADRRDWIVRRIRKLLGRSR